MSIEFQTRVSFCRTTEGWLRCEASDATVRTATGDPAIIEVGTDGGRFMLRCLNGRSMEVKPGDYIMSLGCDPIGVCVLGFSDDDYLD